MKRKIFCILGVLVVLAGIWIVGTGFRTEPSAFIDDYSLNDDSSVMTIHTGVGSSMGFLRKVVIQQNADGEMKLTFLSAFGGVNGSICAQNTFEIPLDENTASISIDQGENERLILKRNPISGAWGPVGWIPRSAQ